MNEAEIRMECVGLAYDGRADGALHEDICDVAQKMFAWVTEGDSVSLRLQALRLATVAANDEPAGMRKARWRGANIIEHAKLFYAFAFLPPVPKPAPAPDPARGTTRHGGGQGFDGHRPPPPISNPPASPARTTGPTVIRKKTGGKKPPRSG